MKALIGGRPNRNPTGVGNSRTDIVPLNKSGSGSSESEDDDDDDTPPMNDADTSSAHPDEPLDIDDDDDDTSSKKKPQIQVKPDIKPKIQNLKQSSSSTAPTASSTTKKSKSNPINDFTEVAMAEEATEQQRLKLARAKVESAAQVRIATEKHKADCAKAQLETKLAKLKYRPVTGRAFVSERAMTAKPVDRPTWRTRIDLAGRPDSHAGVPKWKDGRAIREPGRQPAGYHQSSSHFPVAIALLVDTLYTSQTDK